MRQGLALKKVHGRKKAVAIAQRERRGKTQERLGLFPIRRGKWAER